MSPRTSPPQLEGFRFVDFLGQGGFADVYKYERLGRMVAVKVLHSNLGSDNQRAFEAEAHTMAKLSNHPNVVSIFDAGRTPTGSAYLVMEFCPPPNLAVRIRQQQLPYAVAKALEVGIQIAGAVESAHRLDILHRDIKPANILLTEFNRPALTDFGIASSGLASGTAQAEGVSVPWAPPEQLTTGNALTPAADVYALAATLWTLLAGRAPYERSGANDAWSMSKRIRSDPVPSVGRADVPESLERILRTALAKRPEERYQRAEEFARALQMVQAELHLPPTTFEAIEVIRPGGPPRAGMERSGTRVLGFVVIDPEAGPAGEDRTGAPILTRPVGRSARADAGLNAPADAERAVIGDEATTDRADGAAERPSTGSLDRTVRSGMASATAGQVEGTAAFGSGVHGRTTRVMVLAGLMLALLPAVVLVSRMLGEADSGGPSPSTPASAVPLDPVNESVPAVTGLDMTRTGAAIAVRWDAIGGEGYEYLYRAYAADGQPPPFKVTTDNRVTIQGVEGVVCVEIVRRQPSTGSDSETSRRCLRE